jgi:DNA repair exonuclease SbcCD ATPase subunit/predicted phosphodiesterase
MKIAHISDIHFRGIARHKEYTECFENLFEDLANEVKPDYIVCTGDWFHTKTVAITPEVIEKITWVLRKLSSIAPLIGILGNHDGNLANENRQDTITPIANAVDSPRVNIYKQTGMYTMPDNMLRVCVLSPFDKSNWNETLRDFISGQSDDKVSICLYHGSVVGCLTDSDWVMTKGAEEHMDYFSGIDFGLFGDIHQQQFLSFREDKFGNQKPNVAYPGSMIQQNYGESTVKGYLVWDVRSRNDWDVEFRRVHNSSSFVTVQWHGSANETVAALTKEYGLNLAGKSIRVMSRNTIFDIQKTDLTNQLRTQYKATEVVFRFEKKRETATSLYSDGEIEPDDLFNTHKADGGTVAMIDVVVKALKKYVADNQDAVHVVSGSSTEKAMIDLATAYYNKVAVSSEMKRDVVWSLKNMNFSNLYKFGEDNTINFSRMRGITGIFGGNASGKSSIIGAMMFGLFNTTDRGPVKAAHIINRNKASGSAEILFNVAGTDYVLRREVTKSRSRKGIDHEKAAGKLYLAKVDLSGTEIEISSENAETRSDTDKVVRNLIGSSQDYLMTGLASQGEMNRFIKEGPTARKQMISRFLDLRIYEDIYKLANDDLNVMNAKTQRFRGVDFAARMIQLCSEQEKLSNEADKLKEDIEAVEEEITDTKAWLTANHSSKIDSLIEKKRISDEALADLESKRNRSTVELRTHESKIASIEKQLEAEIVRLSGMELESDLQIKKSKLDGLNRKLADLVSSERIGNALAKKQEESVRRLAVVPCGDQYLDACKYIAGANEDRVQLTKTNEELTAIVQDMKLLRQEIYVLGQADIDQLIKSRQLAGRAVEDLQTKLATALSEKSYKEQLNESINSSFAMAQTENEKLKEEYQELLTKIEELESKQEELKSLQQELNDLRVQFQNNMKATGACANKLVTIEADKLEAEKLTAEQKILDAICVAFSKNAIPAMVIQSALPYINAELDNILGGVIPFRVYLQTEVGDSNVLDVMIEDEYSSRIIELASGYEKMIASLALRVALINLSRLPKPDFLVIDEGWDVLDETNVSRAVELLNALKTKFKHILVISHVNALKEAADDFIMIQSGTANEPSFVSY